MNRIKGGGLAVMALAQLTIGITCNDAVAIELAFTGIQSNGTFVVRTPADVAHHVAAGRMTYVVTASSDPRFTTGSSFHSFCVDLSQPALAAPHTYEFFSNQDDTASGDHGIDDLPTPGSLSIGLAKAQAISALYQNRFLEATTAGSLEASAFQLALWEIIFEPASGDQLGTLDLSSGDGTFRVTQGPPPARSLAQSWLDEISAMTLGPVSDGLIGFGSSIAQDHITIIPMPMPGPMMMAGVGLLGGFLMRRRFRS